MGFPESSPGESAESVGAKGFGETAEAGGSGESVDSDVFGRSAPSLDILKASTENLDSSDLLIRDANNPLPLDDSSNDIPCNSGGSKGVPSETVQSLDQKSNKTLVLRGYQQEVAAPLLRGENGIVVLPTGSGKTYVAIKVILDHIEKRKSGVNSTICKIVFLVPNATLATQQSEKIKEYLPSEDVHQCVKITGEDNTPVEEVKSYIKDDEHKVLVMTPAIINNYFEGSEEASMKDLSLMIFDECHHAKEGHLYNLLLERYYHASGASGHQPCQLPQLMGMTASLGIGGAMDKRKALDFMLSMCARFHLRIPPIQVKENIEELEEVVNNPHERVRYVESCEKNLFTQHLEERIMSCLERSISDKVNELRRTEKEFPLDKFIFPADRHAPCYENFVTKRENAMCSFKNHPSMKHSANYIMIALRHLLAYHRSLELVSLLQCKQGFDFLENTLSEKMYQGIDEIIDLWKDNKEELRSSQEKIDQTKGNPKLPKLHQTLQDLFSKQPESKVIIFVQMRVVAIYLAEWLCKMDSKKYRASEYISSGSSSRDDGMTPAQRKDVREGFDGEIYNILVATSLLEEGIDVQACNMVILYMISKDMIGNIQTRGRVRHKGGQIVRFQDVKLSHKEKSNEVMEELMRFALATLQNMSAEEFLIQVNNKKGLHLFPPSTDPPEASLRKAGSIICCLCKSDLGRTQDMRCYLTNHNLVLDSSISDKVILSPREEEKRSMDGMEFPSILRCSGKTKDGKACNNKVGILIRMRSTGYHFGMWKIEQIQVDDNRFTKYQDMKKHYKIEKICIEELRCVAPNKQFPPDKLH